MDKATLEREITEAMGAHGAWKLKLRKAVESGVLPKPAADIACDDQCGFGKWLHGMKGDSAIAGSAHFRDVMSAHAAFHKAAGAVAKMVEQGRNEAAGAALEGADYVGATSKLSRAMRAWKEAG